jgi:hypothetical protein
MRSEEILQTIPEGILKEKENSEVEKLVEKVVEKAEILVKMDVPKDWDFEEEDDEKLMGIMHEFEEDKKEEEKDFKFQYLVSDIENNEIEI